jgi:hypothetical protein
MSSILHITGKSPLISRIVGHNINRIDIETTGVEILGDQS